MRTMDGDEELQEQLGQRPPALQMAETAIIALQKPVAAFLNAAAAVFSMRFLTAFLQIVLEVHAEHDHIAPGWTGMPVDKAGLSSPSLLSVSSVSSVCNLHD
jgi:hypothetical protein